MSDVTAGLPSKTEQKEEYFFTRYSWLALA